MIDKSFTLLKKYCESEMYKGWDPYDGLNSSLFQATPLKDWNVARLILIQAMKRSPMNLRNLLGVPKQYNAKGLGLLLNGYCNIYRLTKLGDNSFGEEAELLEKIHRIANLLIQQQSVGYSGACWGYNFPWQARRLFYFPANTPTVVATSFCSSALFNAWVVTGEERYKDIALSSAEFILRDLHRTGSPGGYLLSYSPLKGNDTVYNAALLGAKTLSLCFHFTGNSEYREVARKIVSAACEGQNSNGSWVYGLLPVQSWIDSFHTGYNLDAISHYAQLCGDHSFDGHLDKGLNFYVSQFFDDDGKPSYYHDATWPIDIHCPGQLWVTLSVLERWDKYSDLSEAVARWTVSNMQDPKGFFYYQLKRVFSSRIPYMRWSNAFMFNALSYYLLSSRSASLTSDIEPFWGR